MIRISPLAPALTLVFALGFASAASADDSLAGAWKLSVGHNDTCTVTLTNGTTADTGTVAQGADCPSGLYAVDSWKLTTRGVQLISPSGQLVATLKANGTAYEGKRFVDDRAVALSRTQVGAAQ